MDTSKLHALLTNPGSIGPEEARWLEEIMEEFPYFNAPRWLHLHWLNQQGSFKYNQELKRVAIQSGNRERLRQFILAEPEAPGVEKVLSKPGEPVQLQEQPIPPISLDTASWPTETIKKVPPVEEARPTVPPELKVPGFLAAADQALEVKRNQALEAAKRMIELNKRIRMQLENTELPNLEEVDPQKDAAPVPVLESSADSFGEPVEVNPPAPVESEDFTQDEAEPATFESSEKPHTPEGQEKEIGDNDGWTGSFPAVLPGMVAMAVEQPEVLEEEELQKPKSFEPAASEKHSFTEWLKLSSGEQPEAFHFAPTPDEPVLPVSEPDPVRKAKFDLIEQFISQQPQLRPKKAKLDLPQVNMAALSAREESGPVTETLARVYVEQKHYEAAIQAYEILRLKYPEKSSFFATQISAIRKLMT